MKSRTTEKSGESHSRAETTQSRLEPRRFAPPSTDAGFDPVETADQPLEAPPGHSLASIAAAGSRPTDSGGIVQGKFWEKKRDGGYTWHDEDVDDSFEPVLNKRGAQRKKWWSDSFFVPALFNEKYLVYKKKSRTFSGKSSGRSKTTTKEETTTEEQTTTKEVDVDTTPELTIEEPADPKAQIDQTTFEHLKQGIRERVRQGDTLDTIAKDLEEMFDFSLLGNAKKVIYPTFRAESLEIKKESESGTKKIVKTKEKPPDLKKHPFFGLTAAYPHTEIGDVTKFVNDNKPHNENDKAIGRCSAVILTNPKNQPTQVSIEGSKLGVDKKHSAAEQSFVVYHVSHGSLKRRERSISVFWVFLAPYVLVVAVGEHKGKDSYNNSWVLPKGDIRMNNFRPFE